MNGYVCFWQDKEVEIRAETLYRAQQEAVSVFQREAGRKQVRPGDVTVVLAEKGEQPVTHIALF